MLSLTSCKHCHGFLPPGATTCPHCDQIAMARPGPRWSRLRRLLLRMTGGSAVAVTLMACYGMAPHMRPMPAPPSTATMAGPTEADSEASADDATGSAAPVNTSIMVAPATAESMVEASDHGTAPDNTSIMVAPAGPDTGP